MINKQIKIAQKLFQKAFGFAPQDKQFKEVECYFRECGSLEYFDFYVNETRYVIRRANTGYLILNFYAPKDFTFQGNLGAWSLNDDDLEE